MKGKKEQPSREARIIEHLRSSHRGPLKAKDLARGLEVPTSEYKGFKRLLASMERDGRVYRVRGQRYAVPDKINLTVGRLTVRRSGDGFVVPESGGEDVYVVAQAMDSAMDGDQVVARIEGRGRGRQPMGRIIKVLERAHPTLVGTYRRSRHFGYVVPHDGRIARDVMVPRGDEGQADEGDVVVVRISAFGDRKLSPVGEVEKVLGKASDPGVDVQAILHGHGLPEEFPRDVEEAALDMARRAGLISPAGRVDRRDLHVFTIDPADARDHDDALSVAALEEGLVEVGIHIADVSHFVEKGGTLDLEALNRGTSVYLVDRVVPMLPHELSSHLCSLQPQQDRLAVSLFVRLDAEGRLRGHRFERTVIRSRRKLAYEDVQEVLDGRTSLDEATDRSLQILVGLARRLRSRREERGSLDFDLPEARVVLGEQGEPLDIQRVLRLESHRLVEDFMLLANEVVARRATERKLPILHRVHEPPATDRLENLRDFLASIGHSLPKGRIGPRHLQRVLERVRGRPEESLVSTVILRSMARARYAVESVGHFGLATRHYTHFTSPIRRYPDLVVHRVVVRAFIEGRPVPEEWAGEELEQVAERASDRERKAQDAERDSVELKKIEFMERHLGDEFRGTISGVTAFGFFVLLDDYFVEGLVHVSSLDDDYYVFREAEYSLVGERRGRRFRLADRVEVQVVRADKVERKIDFLLTEGGRSDDV